MERINAESQELKLMFKQLQEILRCQICLSVVRGNTRQCVQSHLLCAECGIKFNDCPTCHSPISNYRNLIAEQVAETLLYPCKNTSCDWIGTREASSAHTIDCPFRRFTCPQKGCKWTGFKPEMHPHFNSSHPESILASNEEVVEIPLNLKEKEWSLFYHEEIFRIVFSMHQDALHGVIICFNNSRTAERFKYTMTLKFKSTDITFTKNLLPECDISDIFTNKQSSIYIPIPIVKQYLEDGANSESESSDPIKVFISLKEINYEIKGQGTTEAEDVPRSQETRNNNNVINSNRFSWCTLL